MAGGPVRHVLFDLDDVLYGYDQPRRRRILAAVSGRSLAAIDAAIWASGFENAADRGDVSAEAYLSGFAARLGCSLGRAGWVAARAAVAAPMPETLALAARLKTAGIGIGILSNNGFVIAEEIDTLFPALRPLFGPRILMSAEIGAMKPEAEAYRRAIHRFGFDAEATLFTDDREENVRGAQACGLTGHVYDGASGLEVRLIAFGVAF